MAETKKRTGSGRSSSSGKKNTSARRGNTKRNNSKNAGGPDLLTIVVVIVAVILVTILILNYKKEKEENNGTGTKPTAVLTQTPSEPEPTKTPAPTKEPEATKAPTAAPVPTEEPIEDPIPTEEPVIPRAEAKALLEQKINTERYQTELLSDDLPIDGKSYYLFCIDDKNGNTYEPLVIVEKKNGFVYYYDPLTGTVSDFNVFPPDETEKQGTTDEVITGEQAVAVLKQYSAAKLGLEKEVSQYQTEVDDWSSIVNSKECYGISVFEVTGGKTRLRGSFYVSFDGKQVFKQDAETNEFIEIK